MIRSSSKSSEESNIPLKNVPHHDGSEILRRWISDDGCLLPASKKHIQAVNQRWSNVSFGFTTLLYLCSTYIRPEFTLGLTQVEPRLTPSLTYVYSALDLSLGNFKLFLPECLHAEKILWYGVAMLHYVPQCAMTKMIDVIKAQSIDLVSIAATRSASSRIKSALPEIEQKLRAGLTYKQIVRQLNSAGIRITDTCFSAALCRARKANLRGDQ